MISKTLSNHESVEVAALAYISIWKPLLHLQDWDVEVEVPAHDIEACGYIKYSMEFQNAMMTIRDPAMHPPGSFGNADLEYTVVHELLHLLFCVTPKADDTQNALHERAIDHTAITLVTLRRATLKRPRTKKKTVPKKAARKAK